MKKEMLQEFTTRVTQANGSQLTVTMFDIILVSLQDAKDAFGKEDMAEWQKSLERAQALTMELAKALDHKYAISKELLSLYLFVNRKILHCLVRKKIELLDGVDKVVKNLRDAFEKVSEEDHSKPLMMNAQKVYAGLTYGKGSDLSEVYQTEANRGFQA